MSRPFNPEWLKPGAAVEVSMDNLAAYHAEVQRLMEENAALRAALAEPVQPVAWLDSDGFPWSKEGIECRNTKDTYTPLYTAPPQRKPRHVSYVCPQCHWTLDVNGGEE